MTRVSGQNDDCDGFEWECVRGKGDRVDSTGKYKVIATDEPMLTQDMMNEFRSNTVLVSLHPETGKAVIHPMY